MEEFLVALYELTHVFYHLLVVLSHRMLFLLPMQILQVQLILPYEVDICNLFSILTPYFITASDLIPSLFQLSHFLIILNVNVQ